MTSMITENRQSITIRRIEGNRKRTQEDQEPILWFDTRQQTAELGEDSMFTRATKSRYSGYILTPANYADLAIQIRPSCLRILATKTSDELSMLENLDDTIPRPDVIASESETILAEAKRQGYHTSLHVYVDDGPSLQASADRGTHYDYLAVRFRDPTNIPLELVIASLQATDTVLIKEIATPTDVEDAIVTLGVMEVGADGVMFTPEDHNHFDLLMTKLDSAGKSQIALQPGVVTESTPIGMGYRSCIDTTTLFSPTEGMLVGSTSSGGILCCAEVFYLPYMELRPFRINAGAVHSYVYNFDDRTDYMSELTAGASLMVVGIDGSARRASVGRIKTEIRPLRLIKIKFADDSTANIIMQDDWHVRVFCPEGKPLNITELREGDRVMGYPAEPGRHVGIKVDEHIIES